MNPLIKKLRTALLLCVVLVVFTVFVLQLMKIQIVGGPLYKALAEQGTAKNQTVEAARGEILDRYGTPLAANATGYNVVLDRAFLPKERTNQIILDLTRVLQDAGEEWIDNLPITHTQPFRFEEGYDAAVTRLKKDIDVQPSASVDNVLYWLTDRYKLQDFSPEEQRAIAGVRYEMERRGFNFEVRYTFAENVAIATVAKVKERGYALEGVDVVESPIRKYVGGDIAPHIVGFIGPIYQEEYEKLKEKGYKKNETIGKAGIEQRFEDVLRGKAGTRRITVNSSGDPIDVVDVVEPTPGNTLVLTLDAKMQQVMLNSFERQIKLMQETYPPGEGKEADAGSAVAIDVKTGEILAMVNYPSYDMDTYRSDYSSLVNDPRLPLFNRALQGTYAPGSCFKPTVATAGLATGLTTADTTVLCGRVYTYFQDYHPTCLGSHGMINAVDALRYSCNIYFYDIGRQLGIDTIGRYAADFGLGQPTGIELYEDIGQVSSPQVKAKDRPDEPWGPGDVVQSAIGQSYSKFTPLQLANYAATLANRGKRMQAHIVKSIESYNFDATVSKTEPRVAAQVDAPPEAFETVIAGMVKASRAGTAQRYFGNYPIDVASKTGTPETHAFPNSTFIAFAPANDPKIAVAVLIEKGWHGYTGAPIAKDVFDQYFYSTDRQSASQEYGVLLP